MKLRLALRMNGSVIFNLKVYERKTKKNDDRELGEETEPECYPLGCRHQMWKAVCCLCCI